MIKNSRYSFLLILLFGFINCAPGQKLTNNEKTRIKSIKITGYSSDLREKEADKGKAYTFKEYDANGNLIKSEQYDINGDFKGRYLYEYDNHGNQIKSSTYSSSTQINTLSRSEYVYFGNGKRKKKYHQSGDKYRPNNNVSETEYFYEKDNLLKEIRREIYLGQEEMVTIEYKYNKLKSIDSTYVYRDEDLYKTTTFQYNDNGLLSESFETTHPKGGNPEYIMTVLKKYDEAENITLEIAEDQTGFYYKKLFEFNSLGLKTKFQEFKKNGDIIADDSYEYTLDKNQNWINSKMYSFRKDAWITEREIEYYK